MRDGLVRLGRGAGDAEHHDDFLDGQPLDQLAGHLRLAIRGQGTDVACDDALAETINGLYKAKVIHRPSWKNAAALEELEAARLAFRALVEASLPKPPAEKSPHHGHDYEGAPEWATHILEGFPSDGIYVYAQWDRDGQCYRGSPHERHTAISAFVLVGDGADGDEEDCGWQVVSARGQAEPIGERRPDQP